MQLKMEIKIKKKIQKTREIAYFKNIDTYVEYKYV